MAKKGLHKHGLVSRFSPTLSKPGDAFMSDFSMMLLPSNLPPTNDNLQDAT